MYIDTHCHLNFEAFKNDWLETAEKAKRSGVSKMIVIGTDLKNSQKAIELAEKVEYLYATVGFHPHHVKGFEAYPNTKWSTKLEKKLKDSLKKATKSKKVVAIGECGLDYFRYKKTKYPSTMLKINKKSKILQKRLFGVQIQLAKELALPMVIHSRKAHDDLLDTLNHFCKNDGKYPTGVFHCVSGSRKHLKKVLKLGFYLGVDGNITYSKEVQRLVKEIPLNKLVIETDSPFLIPEPWRSNPALHKVSRGKHLRNEPISVKITAKFIANLKNVNLTEIKTKTTENAKRLFNI